MKTTTPALTTLFIILLTSCSADVKGRICDQEEMLINGDGDAYCLDENAPQDCEALFEAYVERTIGCLDDAGLELSDAERADLRADMLDEARCERAVATTTDREACLSQIEEAACPADELILRLPDLCTSVVLVAADS